MHPAPGYLSNNIPVVDGQYGVAQLGYSGAWDEFGPIVHTLSADGLTVRNYTVEGHKLHPGYVGRTVFVRDGPVYMRTIGEGAGAYPGINNALSRPLWNGVVDSHIRYRVNLGYRHQ